MNRRIAIPLAPILRSKRGGGDQRRPYQYSYVDIASVAKIFPHILVTEDNLKDFQSYNIPKKDLMIKSAEAEKYLKVAPVTKTHRVKWLPSEVKFETDTLIWEGHTAILDYSQSLSGVIIDNPAIAKTFEAWFDIIWGNIKEEILYA